MSVWPTYRYLVSCYLPPSPPFSSRRFSLFSGYPSCLLVVGRCPGLRLATSCFIFLVCLLCCVLMSWGWCSRGVVLLCLRGPCRLSLCCLAPSSRGASASVHHAAFFLPLCPLASCLVMVPGCTLDRLCTTCACARLCCGCGGWALLCFLVCLKLLWLRQLG